MYILAIVLFYFILQKNAIPLVLPFRQSYEAIKMRTGATLEEFVVRKATTAITSVFNTQYKTYGSFRVFEKYTAITAFNFIKYGRAWMV